MNLLSTTRNIHAVGRNYSAHIRELGNVLPSEPVLFSKSPSTLAWGDTLLLPSCLGPIHHELELVLRLGKTLPVGAFTDLSCISHITLGIDFTAREKQAELKGKQLPWHLAKNFEGGCYVAPFQVFTQEQALTFSLDVNGQTRQTGDSRNMIYGYRELLAFLNRTLPLKEGDLLFTGTPEGVAPVAQGDRLQLRCAALHIDQQVTVSLRT